MDDIDSERNQEYKCRTLGLCVCLLSTQKINRSTVIITTCDWEGRPFDSLLGSPSTWSSLYLYNLIEDESMYLLYLDESGDPYSWQNQKCYVIGGVAIHEGQVHGISSQMDSLQAKYFPGIQVQIAFHATEVRRGKGHFLGISPARRKEILQDVYALVGNTAFPNLIAFATAIDITAVRDPTQARRDIFEDVCEKFNGFLVHQYQHGRPTKGLLLIDENREAEYRQLVNDFKKQGTTHGYLGNVVDIPYFARCHQTRMLQLADFIANAVFEYYEKNDNTDLNTILPRFYGEAWGKLSLGLGHITGNKCDCVVHSSFTPLY